MKIRNQYIKKSTIVFMVWNFSILLLIACGRKEPVLLENFTEEPSDEAIMDETEVQIEQKSADSDSEKLKKQQTDGDTGVTEKSGEDTVCYVHICGAVMNPGVYQMTVTSRIYEAVAMAGGFREDACTEYLNQAELVCDGEQIRIPTEAEAEEYEKQPMQPAAVKAQGVEKQTKEDGLININTADESTLCTLPGIGSLKAASIIAFREQNGGFASIEDILQVDGIKSGTYNKLKDKITV